MQALQRRAFPLRFATLIALLATPTLAACDQDTEEPEVQAQEAMDELDALAIDIDLPPDTSDEDLQTIARGVEKAGGDSVVGAKVAIQKQDGDDPATTIHVELMGNDLPSDEQLVRAIQDLHPALADAPIRVASIDTPSESMPVIHSDAEDPADVEAEIRDQLEAQGVDGDVQVEVRDGPNGREVEVKVEKREEHGGDVEAPE